MKPLFAQRATAAGAFTLATLLGLGVSTLSANAHEGEAMSSDMAGAMGHMDGMDSMGDMPGMSSHNASHQALPGSGFGRPGQASAVIRTVQIDMTDNMRFTPDTVQVHPGETVRFVIHNRGQVLHEMVLGSPEVLKAHQEMMRQAAATPDAPHVHSHAGGNMAHVAPGQTGEIVWQFTEPGRVAFACLLPGHYEAGMKGQVIAQ